ncbi:TRAP transporter fused permease subunit [bacterium]|nr:TRAP transporter fused permease subunit [bacterium]
MPQDRSTGKSDTLQRILDIALKITAVVMVVYHLAFTQVWIQDPTGHRVTHLGLAFMIILLSQLLRNPAKRFSNWLLLFASVGVSAYLMYFLQPIMEYRQAIPIWSDLVVGVVLIVVVFVVTYRVFGKGFPIITTFFVAYLVLGRFLPRPFTVAPLSLTRIIMWLSAGVGLEQGIYGGILGLSANYLFLLILFGSLLHGFGGMRFVIGIARWVGSKLKSGPAAVAVLGSSLLGSMTGSTVANISITGTFTIPMMKSVGYSPAQAGAVEAASSNGGQIMPPIMGATAFVMAGYIGIPYINIAKAALIPAIIYYLGLVVYVQLTAYKMDVQAPKEKTNYKELLLDAPIFLLPLAVLMILLIKGNTLPYVAFWSMMTLIGTGILSSIRKEARLNLRGLLDTIVSGAVTACEVAVICAMIGMVASSVETSGVGIKLPLIIKDLSHGYLIVALFITMISSIILGMGVPTTAAYLLAAIGAAPALTSMGVPILQAHFFIFVFAAFSHLTPPVAVGALVASRLANADYWTTSKEAVRAAYVAFLLPFFVIYAPVVVMAPGEDLFVSIAQVVAIAIGVFSFQVFLCDYCFSRLEIDEKIAFALATVLCVAGVFLSGQYFLIHVGIGLFLLSTFRQFKKRHRLKRA